MTKKLTAYFRSENDATAAQIALETLGTNKVYVEEIPAEGRQISVLPIAPLGQASGVTGFVGVDNPDSLFNNGEDNHEMTHVIEAEVEEEDYEEAVKVLHEHNGYKDNKED